MPKDQRLAVTFSAFEAEPGKPDRDIKREEFVIFIDDDMPGGFKSQAADIENKVVAALNRVQSALANDRGEDGI